MFESESERHPTLYFPDGNLVIVCRKENPTYFRVHQTVMARDSPVFADMFTVPLPPDGKDHLYDGVPLVEFPDDPNDMTTFLRCFYEPFASPISDTDPDVASLLSGVFEIADRLMMEPLKQAILDRIRLDWPSTLEEWEFRHKFYSMAHGEDLYPDPVPVIRIGHRYDPSLLVPSLFYELSARDPSKIQWNLLDEKDIVKAFAGRQHMLNWLVAESSLWTEGTDEWTRNPWTCISLLYQNCTNSQHQKRADYCTLFRTRLFVETYARLISCRDVLKELEYPIGKKGTYDEWMEERMCDASVNVCDSCDLTWDRVWKKSRDDLFKQLPKFFKIL